MADDERSCSGCQTICFWRWIMPFKFEDWSGQQKNNRLWPLGSNGILKKNQFFPRDWTMIIEDRLSNDDLYKALTETVETLTVTCFLGRRLLSGKSKCSADIDNLSFYSSKRMNRWKDSRTFVSPYNLKRFPIFFFAFFSPNTQSIKNYSILNIHTCWNHTFWKTYLINPDPTVFCDCGSIINASPHGQTYAPTVYVLPPPPLR